MCKVSFDVLQVLWIVISPGHNIILKYHGNLKKKFIQMLKK